MLAHYEQGTRVNPAEMLQSARVVGPRAEGAQACDVRTAGLAEPAPASRRSLPRSQRASWESFSGSPRARSTSRSAHELTLSTSTVRTHLHNIYGKLGAVDRAQAVLIATERGWL